MKRMKTKQNLKKSITQSQIKKKKKVVWRAKRDWMDKEGGYKGEGILVLKNIFQEQKGDTRNRVVLS